MVQPKLTMAVRIKLAAFLKAGVFLFFFQRPCPFFFIYPLFPSCPFFTSLEILLISETTNAKLQETRCDYRFFCRTYPQTIYHSVGRFSHGRKKREDRIMIDKWRFTFSSFSNWWIQLINFLPQLNNYIIYIKVCCIINCLHLIFWISFL